MPAGVKLPRGCVAAPFSVVVGVLACGLSPREVGAAMLRPNPVEAEMVAEAAAEGAPCGFRGWACAGDRFVPARLWAGDPALFFQMAGAARMSGVKVVVLDQVRADLLVWPEGGCAVHFAWPLVGLFEGDRLPLSWPASLNVRLLAEELCVRRLNSLELRPSVYTAVVHRARVPELVDGWTAAVLSCAEPTELARWDGVPPPLPGEEYLAAGWPMYLPVEVPRIEPGPVFVRGSGPEADEVRKRLLSAGWKVSGGC